MHEAESLREAFDRFLSSHPVKASTKLKFRTKFKLFLEKYGDEKPGDITADMVQSWFDYMENRLGYSEGHLAFHRNCHKKFWSWLGQAKAIPYYSPAPTRVITANLPDVDLALGICERQMWTTITHQRDAAIFAIATVGPRRSNLAGLRYSEVRHALAHPLHTGDRKYYVVLCKEGKQTMEAILDERRASIVRRYVESRPATRHDRLFVILDPARKDYLQPLSNEGLRRARERVCKLAGIEPVNFQMLRRMIGTVVADKTDIEKAARVLGHRSGTRVIEQHYLDKKQRDARLALLDSLGY